MYILITFILIILIPTFFGLLITTNVKENIRSIAIVGLVIVLILGYMYIPKTFPISKNIAENALVYYEDYRADKYYQEKFLLIPKDMDTFMSLLKQEKFYHLMDDRQYYYSKSSQFELFDRDYMEHCWLKINRNTYSTLSIGNKDYRFMASPELLQVTDEFSRTYGAVAYENTRVDSVKLNLLLKESKEHTYFFDLDIHTEDKDVLITEINLYYVFNQNESSLTYLLDESPITNFKDTIEVSMIRGKGEYLKEAKDCQLIIRGQHKVKGEIVPFQKLVDMDELI